MAIPFFSLSSPLLQFVLSIAPLFFLLSGEPTAAAFKDVSLENPTLHLGLLPQSGHSCERVAVTGLSRLNLKSYSSSLLVKLKVSELVPERLYEKLAVCFHRNASLGLCQCGKDDWKNLQKGQWMAVLSPYDNRYIDVKLKDKAVNSITVSVEEEFQRWRLICLGFGFLLLLLAPVVSNWVPFYYSSSMALGIMLVVLVILYQGMRLLPMGRKSVLYLTFYGSVLGVGSYIAHYFSTVVNSILVSFGLSEEMYNPVSVFLLVGIIIAGAGFGYWIVRKFFLSEDGTVDAGIAQFVKWAMRVIAVFFVFQSSLDAILATVALGICWSISSVVTLKKWRSSVTLHPKNKNLWQRNHQLSSGKRNAEFLSRSPKKDLLRSVRGSPSSQYAPSNLSMKGQAYSSPSKMSPHQHEDYYSSFHKTPIRKFSKSGWEDFTRESTREALSEWASTPDVAKWIADNAHRMRLGLDDDSVGSMESSSGSSEETVVEDGGRLNLLKWRY